jgi:hypothetical protein
MPSSPARIASNRRNASYSCGPKTVEGKARSRQNALKHGLTGQGVALPTEDTVEIERRFESLVDEFRPSTEAGRILVRRFSFLSVRLERCERHETTVLTKRVRDAIGEYDDQRMAEIELHASRISSDPMTSSRRLQATPEGIDWLVAYWLELRGDLMVEDRVVWTWNHWDRAESLMGNPEGNLRVSRTRALTEAVSGFFANLAPTDGAGLDDAARTLWAKGEIAAMIDAEVARLQEVRISLDPDSIERDRLEAPDRALFDPSREMILARKYEGATERAMYKALKEFKEVEAAASKLRESDAAYSTESTCEPLALNGSGPEPGYPTAEVRPPLPRRSMPISPLTVPFSTLRVVEEAPVAVESAEMANC